MSDDLEKKDDTSDESSNEELRKIIESITGEEDTSGDLLEMVKQVSADLDLKSLIETGKEETVRKESAANEITERIHALFEKREFHYTPVDSKGRVVLLGFNLVHSTVRPQIVIEDEFECIKFNIPLFTCLKEYRIAMYEYIAELNYPLCYGSFHINMEDGEVTFHYAYSYMGIPFNEEAFEVYLGICMGTVDNNYRELSRIANGRLSDEEKKNWFIKIKQFAIALSQ